MDSDNPFGIFKLFLSHLFISKNFFFWRNIYIEMPKK
jgi:hypothetical protein